MMLEFAKHSVFASLSRKAPLTSMKLPSTRANHCNLSQLCLCPSLGRTSELKDRGDILSIFPAYFSHQKAFFIFVPLCLQLSIGFCQNSPQLVSERSCR